MEHADRLAEQNIYFWLEWSQRLERAGKIDQALDALTNAFERGRALIGPEGFDEGHIFGIQLQRARFLIRHGRVADGIAERLAALRIPNRGAGSPANLIDLSSFYNTGLKPCWVPGFPFWIELEGLPLKCQTLLGVQFDLRGVVQLLSARLKLLSAEWPEKVAGVPVTQPCLRLHFLHAADQETADGTRIASYVVHYQDGAAAEIPIIYGKDVLAWNHDDDRPGGGPRVAWSGRNASSLSIRLFLTTWQNPRPEARVETIDLVSAMSPAAPFIVAITAE